MFTTFMNQLKILMQFHFLLNLWTINRTYKWELRMYANKFYMCAYARPVWLNGLMVGRQGDREDAEGLIWKSGQSGGANACATGTRGMGGHGDWGCLVPTKNIPNIRQMFGLSVNVELGMSQLLVDRWNCRVYKANGNEQIRWKTKCFFYSFETLIEPIWFLQHF